MRDVAKFLTSKQTTSDKDLAANWAKLENLFNKKLWHQLTIELLSFVKNPGLQKNNELIQLYEEFIADFENKINLLSLAEICATIVKQFTTAEDRLKFLEQLSEKVKSNKEALALCKVQLGNIKLHEQNDQAETKKYIEEAEKILDETDGITSVHGCYYLLCSDFYRIQGKHADYYRAALRYLGCTDLQTLSIEEQRRQAFHLGIAALLGDGIYNLGELLAHPVLESLNNQEEKWLVDLLFVMNSGDIAGFHQLKPKWSTQADLLSKERAILQKITLLALMEMTFKRPATKRNLTFKEIAETTGVQESEVELLVMKALAQGLLKGTIDHIYQTLAYAFDEDYQNPNCCPDRIRHSSCNRHE
nr:EOG090X05V9 [Cyclestheria hislopi]